MTDKQAKQEAMEQARAELAKRRLLKANNVQRRRFEKMADELITKAERRRREDEQDERTIIMKGVVKEIMGEDLEKLLEIRRRVQSLKQQIEGYQEQAQPIKKRLIEKGLTGGTYRYDTDRGWNWYLDPDPVDPKEDEDVCAKKIVGDPNIRLSIKECRGNDAFVRFEQRTLDLDLERDELEAAAEDLRASIWQLVTTDEIREALETFRKGYIV
jgi:hypothetical protein